MVPAEKSDLRKSVFFISAPESASRSRVYIRPTNSISALRHPGAGTQFLVALGRTRFFSPVVRDSFFPSTGSSLSGAL